MAFKNLKAGLTFQGQENVICCDISGTLPSPALNSQAMTELEYNNLNSPIYYNAEIECPWPKSGCVIFYTYCLDNLEHSYLLISNSHHSSDILGYEPSESNLEDLHLFPTDDSLRNISSPKDLCTMIKELFNSYAAYRYLDPLTLVDSIADGATSKNIKFLDDILPSSGYDPKKHGDLFIWDRDLGNSILKNPLPISPDPLSHETSTTLLHLFNSLSHFNQ